MITKARNLQYVYPDSALLFLGQAKSICRQYRLESQLIECFNSTSAVYISQGNLSLAVREYQVAIELCKENKLYSQQGLMQLYLGNLYQYMGNYSKAAENYLPSAALLQSNVEKKRIIGIYRNILSVITNLKQQNLSLQNVLPLISSEITNETELVQLLAQKNTGSLVFDFPDQTIVQEVDKGMAYVILGGAKFPISSLLELQKFTTIYRIVQKIPAGSLSSIPDIPQEGTLIKGEGGAVYLIKNRERHWIQSFEVLDYFGGFDAVCVSPSGTITQVPDAGDTVTLLNIQEKFNFKSDYQFLTDSLKSVLQENIELTMQVGNRLKEKNLYLQKQKAWLWGTVIGLAGLVSGLFLLFLNYRQKQEHHKESLLALRAEEKLSRHLAIEKERTRIATDMHDDLGAGLSSLRFLAEKVKRNSFSDITKDDISKMQLTSSELMDKMNEIIWAMNEKNDTLEDLLFYSRNYAMSYCEENGLECKFELPDDLKNIMVSGEFRRNIFLILKECLHNIVKHACARNVSIIVSAGKDLKVVIKDDGKGITENSKNTFGNGLLNIQRRIELMKSQLKYFNDNGLTIIFTVPLE